MAAGMTLPISNIGPLREALNRYALKHITPEMRIPKLEIDGNLAIKDIDCNLVQSIKAMEPFGAGNKEPLFLVEGQLSQCYGVGQDKKHMKVAIKEGTATLNGIGFSLMNHFEESIINHPYGFVGTLELNTWNQKTTPQIMVKDAGVTIEAKKLSKSFYELARSVFEDDSYSGVGVTRDQLIMIYKLLDRKQKANKQKIHPNEILINLELSEAEGTFRILVCFEIFAELKLLNFQWVPGESILFVWHKDIKVNLEQSELYLKYRMT